MRTIEPKENPYISDKMTEYDTLLKSKIREEFKDSLDQKYSQLVNEVENPSDDRQFISNLALNIGIPVMVNFIKRKERKTYEIALILNEIPKIVGVKGSDKFIQDKARQWKDENKWIDDTYLVTKRQLLNSSESDEFKILIPEDYKGKIYSNSSFLKIDSLPELVGILRANKYDTSILSEWLKALTLVAREFPRLAYETHMEINAKQQQQRILQLEAPMQVQEQEKEYQRKARERIAPTLFRMKPDRPETRGYLYAFASAPDAVQFKIKIGRCNKPKQRNTQQNNSHADDVDYFICLPVFDAYLAERFLHRILQQCNFLHHNREFYRISVERATDVVKKTVAILDQGVNEIFVPSIQDARQNYIDGNLDLPDPDDAESPRASDEEDECEDLVLKITNRITDRPLPCTITMNRLEKHIRECTVNTSMEEFMILAQNHRTIITELKRSGRWDKITFATK